MSSDPHSAPDVYEAEFADEPRPPRKTSFAGWVMIAMMISILVVPLIYMLAPQETAKWYLAAAEEQRLDGDIEGALQNLDQAIERFPEQAQLLRKRAEWRMEDEDYEAALADIDRAIQLAPTDVEGLMLRSQILQHLGRFAAAVDDMEKLVEFSERQWGIDRATALNGVAYARALANQDLDQALTEVEQALQLVPRNGAMLDTRGFVHYLQGNLEQARADMDEAVELIEADHERFERQLNGQQMGVLDKREGQLRLEQHAQGVAVIRYHRSLVYEELGDTAAAEADRQRILELGHEPGDHLF